MSINPSHPFWKPYMEHCNPNLLIRLWMRGNSPNLSVITSIGINVMLTRTPFGIIKTKERINMDRMKHLKRPTIEEYRNHFNGRAYKTPPEEKTIDRCRSHGADHMAYGWCSQPDPRWSDEQMQAYINGYYGEESE